MFPRFASPSCVHLPGEPAWAAGAATRTAASSARTARRIGMGSTLSTGSRARKSVRRIWEHVFVTQNPNLKGNIAESAIRFAAVKLGVPVFTPVAEHGRADLVLDIGDRLYRVQCKWGRLDRDGSVISVGVESNR